ncbi:MAG: CDP-alcohol phosphatidyltransferase family protein [Bacteroidales bacterium]|jgi:CDP-diacylglycerol--serine O-phosphatidyltransferase|nr:CDP-alcohol phosphatidyltransferase family protein [Bacteroidales bacterium]MCU0409457.1 CDP-alcohol phosphatidyltransferase family protein [Bacteroidales bacterium]
MVKYIPNFLTSLNLVSGFFAIILAASGNTAEASWLIIAAMVFDFSDGFAARSLKAYSDVGKELDSLADLVSFGVAPALIIFVHMKGGLSGPGGLFASAMGEGPAMKMMLLSTALMPVCAALRLAVFNLDTTQSTSFRGLPTPANAIAVISLVLGAEYSGGSLSSALLGSPLFLAALTVMLSLLMVSRIPLLSLKIKTLKLRGNEGRYLLVLLVIIVLIAGGAGAAPLIIPIYIASSLAALLF